MYPDSNLDLSLMQLNKDLQDVSVELENTSLEQNSIEVAAVVSGYIAKKMIKKTKCSDCRVLLTFNSGRGPIPETYDYLLKLSRGGLTLPASDLTDYVCKSFAMLELCETVTRKADLPERVAAEHILKLNNVPLSFLCDNHSAVIKFINRSICNVFFNNGQKLGNSQVRKDVVQNFKQRQRKRQRTSL